MRLSYICLDHAVPTAILRRLRLNRRERQARQAGKRPSGRGLGIRFNAVSVDLLVEDLVEEARGGKAERGGMPAPGTGRGRRDRADERDTRQTDQTRTAAGTACHRGLPVPDMTTSASTSSSTVPSRPSSVSLPLPASLSLRPAPSGQAGHELGETEKPKCRSLAAKKTDANRDRSRTSAERANKTK